MRNMMRTADELIKAMKGGWFSVQTLEDLTVLRDKNCHHAIPLVGTITTQIDYDDDLLDLEEFSTEDFYSRIYCANYTTLGEHFGDVFIFPNNRAALRVSFDFYKHTSDEYPTLESISLLDFVAYLIDHHEYAAATKIIAAFEYL